MPNLFEKLDAWLGPALQAAAGVTVTYTRGAESRAGVPAVVGRTAFASNLDHAARIEFGDRDYLIAAADLPFGEPEEGDLIGDVVNGQAMRFAVTTPTTGEPPCRWSDPGRTTARLHTKRFD